MGQAQFTNKRKVVREETKVELMASVPQPNFLFESEIPLLTITIGVLCVSIGQMVPSPPNSQP